MPTIIPKEALDFLRAKKLKPAFDYRDTWREQHAYAFTVAKVTQQDILKDIKQALDDALAEGITFEKFKKDLTPLLQKKGWWGVRQMVDTLTGETIDVQLGSPRRLQTIFESNIRTARAAGQWARIQRTKKALPYLVYELGPSLEHRTKHQEWSGTILPVDHVFWVTHFTPNGYGCKCRTRQISSRERDRLIAAGGYTETPPKIIEEPWLNKRTGEVEYIPEGIDPGWNTNPGWFRHVSLDRDFLAKAQESGNIEWATKSILSPVRKDEFKIWAASMLNDKRPGAELRTAYIMSDVEIDYLLKNKAELDETLTIVEGSLLGTGKAKRHKNKGDALTKEQWQNLPSYFKQAQHILWDKKRKHFIYLIRSGKKYIKIVVGVNFKSKHAKRMKIAEKLNSVRTAYIVDEKALLTLQGNNEIVKGENK